MLLYKYYKINNFYSPLLQSFKGTYTWATHLINFPHIFLKDIHKFIISSLRPFCCKDSFPEIMT